jgi:hypothetical protein
MHSYADGDMQTKPTWTQRTLLNWRFWVILPVTVILLPLGLVSLVLPFNINWYNRAVRWSQYRHPYNT